MAVTVILIDILFLVFIVLIYKFKIKYSIKYFLKLCLIWLLHYKVSLSQFTNPTANTTALQKIIVLEDFL